MKRRSQDQDTNLSTEAGQLQAALLAAVDVQEVADRADREPGLSVEPGSVINFV